MSDEELSQFYQHEAAVFSSWLDHSRGLVEERFAQPGLNVMTWRGATGIYRFTRKQFEDFIQIRNSPLYKALK